MSKAIKDDITRSYHERYAKVADACVVDVTRLSVLDVTRLRAELGKRKVKLHVLKNSLARRAFSGTRLEPLGPALSGPCALVTGGDSLIETAKLLIEAKKNYAKLELKSAILDGESSLLTVDSVSKMRGKIEVLGEIAMLVASPARAIAGCIGGPGRKVAGCVKTIGDREEPATAAAA